MRFKPQRASNFQDINPKTAPPRCFVTRAVELAMMTATQRNGELVADFTGESAALREPKVMRIGRKSAAHEARTAGYQSDVVAIANPTELRHRQHALVDGIATGKISRLVRLRTCF
jgi:hypothetical protein